jgi:hypothetical protein
MSMQAAGQGDALRFLLLSRVPQMFAPIPRLCGNHHNLRIHLCLDVRMRSASQVSRRHCAAPRGAIVAHVGLGPRSALTTGLDSVYPRRTRFRVLIPSATNAADCDRASAMTGLS